MRIYLFYWSSSKDVPPHPDTSSVINQGFILSILSVLSVSGISYHCKAVNPSAPVLVPIVLYAIHSDQTAELKLLLLEL